ncbi:MAG: hypothetical protein ACI4EV_03415 [Lachnospiraceae bacterium]
MKSLQTIQKLFKVGNIITQIVYVCCIVGIIGCIIGIVGIGVVDGVDLQYDGSLVTMLIEKEAGITIAELCAVMGIAIFALICELYVTRKGLKYYKCEFEAGTPFDLDCAAQLKKIGILKIALSLAVAVVSAIVREIFVLQSMKFTINISDQGNSVTCGIGLLVLALICKYGAEILEEKKQN